ncbi:DUF2513 domain-containing protein [Virgibacillus necropolis]|uniref:DUF2513 domain-containing protein n=1 Tax=Virgibacillus necropolis TaxID=163877 RepID=UPI00384B217A
MKRDLKLVRDLLLFIEEKYQTGHSFQINSDPEGRTQSEIQYHLRIMAEANLIKVLNASSKDGETYFVEGITWEGHDFLDSARNEKVWEKADETAKKEGTRLNDLSFEVAKSLLVASAKQLFNLQ